MKNFGERRKINESHGEKWEAAMGVKEWIGTSVHF
jgi:hypothetical protein